MGAVMSGMEDTADIDKGRMFKMSVGGRCDDRKQRKTDSDDVSERELK